MTLKTRKDVLDRFWSKVNTNGPLPDEKPELGPCMVWTRALTTDGYGRFWFEGYTRPAHRWLYEQENEPVPDGYEPDHRCRRRNCVNLLHIEIVTQAENVRRGGIYRQGHAYGNAVINVAKTHCPKNHPYDEANTRMYRGRRNCRACAREGWHSRKKAA